jgi:hypothetical protein
LQKQPIKALALEASMSNDPGRLPTLATKADLDLLKAELKAEIQGAAATQCIWWAELIMSVCIGAIIFLVMFALLFALGR